MKVGNNMKATINAYCEWTADGDENAKVNLDGHFSLQMKLIALIIVGMEESLPEEYHAKFRADILKVINEVRKERSNVHT